ncbi:SDR family oxidoreductase [Crossiella cryophila]|uniref:Uncharacterized protein YbjT (DUF2867 family) n=1 Tax=Crossiella cryophila TaxID=43355 RepID=A0A7W7CHD9_9PSEU|nr:NAD(P)H-binding protein [Crossiella cryophila]MBB4679788.1 uncharacterized protein YbjT (DUF2867 family) [Crossiella cryophila]
MIIAVHGPTGVQGAPVVSQLLAAGHEVRAVARNPRDLPPGAHATIADLTDPDSLIAAYQGVDAVVLQLPLGFDNAMLTQAESVLKALSTNTIDHVIFNTSGPYPTRARGIPFLDARYQLIRDLPEVTPTFSIIGPAALYNEVLADPATTTDTEVRLPLPADMPVPWVAAADVASAIVELLAAPVPAQLIAGPEELTGPEVAAVLSSVRGREIRWRTVDLAEYEQLMTPYLGAELAAGMAGSFAVVDADEVDPALNRPGSTTLRDWAAV